MKRLLLLLVLMIASPAASQASGMARVFLDGVAHYNQGDFNQAILDFKTVADSGVQNGKLFYNLGNAYLKKGSIGRSLLWYMRAERLIPADPDLRFNLRYAQSLVKDAPEQRGLMIVNTLMFWERLLGENGVYWAAVGANLAFWALVLLQIVRRRKTLSYLKYFVLFVALVLTGTAGFHFYSNYFVKSGIILPEAVSVRSGFSTDDTELFILHSGTQVKIQKRVNDHYLIRFSNDKVGWLNLSAVGRI